MSADPTGPLPDDATPDAVAPDGATPGGVAPGGAAADDVLARRGAAVAELFRTVVPEPPARPGLFDAVATGAVRTARRRRRRTVLGAGASTGLVAAAAAAVLAFGPGPLRLPDDGPARPAATVTDVPGASAAGDRRIARALADRGIALVARPPGAVGTRWPLGTQAGAPWQAPENGGERASRVWRVPMGIADASQWLLDHLPTATAAELRGSYGDSEGMRVYSTTLPLDAGLRSAVRPPFLSLFVRADGPRSTVVWASVEVLWLDPVPLRETPTTTLAVRIADGCPGTWSGDVLPANEGADLDHALLPAARPTGGLVCASWFSGPVRSTRLDAAAAGAFADAVLAMPLGHPVAEYAHGCPAAGGRYLVVLAYPGRPDVALDLVPICSGTTSNGRIRVPSLPDVELGRWAPA